MIPPNHDNILIKIIVIISVGNSGYLTYADMLMNDKNCYSLILRYPYLYNMYVMNKLLTNILVK